MFNMAFITTAIFSKCALLLYLKKIIWIQTVVCNEKYLIRFNISSKLQIYLIPNFYIWLGKTYFFRVCQADHANAITWYDRNFIFCFIKSKLCKTFNEIPCIQLRDVERKVLYNPYLPKKIFETNMNVPNGNEYFLFYKLNWLILVKWI